MPGFPTPPGQPLDDLVRQLDDYRRRLEVLERPPDRIRETGTAPTTAVPILPNGGATASSGAAGPPSSLAAAAMAHSLISVAVKRRPTISRKTDSISSEHLNNRSAQCIAMKP